MTARKKKGLAGHRMNTSTSRRELSTGPSPAILDKMINEATVDAYGESEQLVAFYTVL